MLAPAIDALPGWRAVTDLTTAIGTVPLVAVGPAGAYVVETLDAFGIDELADVPERCLIHAWAQAKHLERRRLGGEVVPILAVRGQVLELGHQDLAHLTAGAGDQGDAAALGDVLRHRGALPDRLVVGVGVHEQEALVEAHDASLLKRRRHA